MMISYHMIYEKYTENQRYECSPIKILQTTLIEGSIIRYDDMISYNIRKVHRKPAVGWFFEYWK